MSLLISKLTSMSLIKCTPHVREDESNFLTCIIVQYFKTNSIVSTTMMHRFTPTYHPRVPYRDDFFVSSKEVDDY